MDNTVVLLALLALGLIVGVPISIAFLFRRQSQLNRQLITIQQAQRDEQDGLRRELARLKSQVASLSPATEAATEIPKETPQAAVPATAPVADKPIARPPVEQPVPVEKPLEPAPVLKPLVTPLAPNAVAERRPEVLSPQIPLKREEPAVANESQPTAAHFAVPSTAGTVSSPAAPVSSKPAPPPSPRTSPISVPARAPTSAQHEVDSFHAAGGRTSAEQRMKLVFALEENLGRNWLNKLGISLLVVGVASFGIYELGQLGALGRVAVSFAVSVALLVGGLFFEKRERYRILGHTLIGGGWALLFFTTYALEHVAAMRVMSSETADLVLMLAAALAMVAHTLRYRSQLVTGVAFLLAYTTVALSHDDVYSLSAGVILALGLVSIVLKMAWFELEIFGILSSYLNHTYWLYRLLGPGGAEGHAFREYHASVALLLFYWITFRVSYIVRKIGSSSDEHMSTTAALLNTLLLLAAMKFQSVRPELAFAALLIIGALEFGFGQLPITKRRREAFVVLSVLGTALMTLAVPFRYSGNNMALLWLIGAQAFLIVGAMVKEVVFRRLGLCAGMLVGAHLTIVDFAQLRALRQIGEQVDFSAGILFALCAAVFYLNVLLIARRWPFFAQRPDLQLISVHSYLGAFAAATAAWAWCGKDWTAVAFAAVMLTLAWLVRTLKSPVAPVHWQTQYGFIAVLGVYRILTVNLHSELPPYAHVVARLVTLPLLAGMFYLTAKWAALSEERNQQTLRGMFASVGTALVTALIYYEIPEFWQPAATILLAVILLEIGQRIRYETLLWHAHLLSPLALLAAITADPSSYRRWHQIPLHAIAALPVVAGGYWIAKRIAVPSRGQMALARGAYSWAGCGLMAWILYEAVPAPWVAVAWIAFAITLALALRRIAYKQLAWQSHTLAACAVIRTCLFNYSWQQTLWHEVSVRLVSVAMVAAGLYFLSRKSTVQVARSERTIPYVHTFTATILLALLAWYEVPGAWVVSVWAVFALVLALVDRQFKLEDLGWQAHALAALSLVRAVVVNLNIVDTWHGVSIRLITLAIVILVLYSLSWLIRMPDSWRAQEFQPVYSWAASALAAALTWYELKPLTVALGWAIFGLLLFEYGFYRKVRQFRFQSYVALSAAFVRIFFANLPASTPGEFFGPRIYTILPITLALFFVYSQLGGREGSVRDDRRLRCDTLLAYLGTATVVAVVYFQWANDWVVAVWASIIVVLFAMAYSWKRLIFLHQALLLTCGVCVRSITHNLFGASYFSGGTWRGRFLVLGLSIAMLVACLPLAFALRERQKANRPARGWLAKVAGHPEQFLFFAPVLLLTLTLALKMRAGMVTVSWGLEGILIMLLALALNERSFRLTGLVLLLLSVAKVLAIDAWGLAPRDRYVTFIILGAALLLASFLYSKYRDAIRQFL